MRVILPPPPGPPLPFASPPRASILPKFESLAASIRMAPPEPPAPLADPRDIPAPPLADRVALASNTKLPPTWIDKAPPPPPPSESRPPDLAPPEPPIKWVMLSSP